VSADMTIQEAIKYLQELLADYDDNELAPRGKAEKVLLAEIEALRGALDKFMIEIDEFNIVAYDDCGYSDEQKELFKTARAILERTK